MSLPAAHFAVIFFHQDKAKSAAAKKAFVALAEAQVGGFKWKGVV